MKALVDVCSQLIALLADWDALADDATTRTKQLEVSTQAGFMYGAMYGFEHFRDELARLVAKAMQLRITDSRK